MKVQNFAEIPEDFLLYVLPGTLAFWCEGGHRMCLVHARENVGGFFPRCFKIARVNVKEKQGKVLCSNWYRDQGCWSVTMWPGIKRTYNRTALMRAAGKKKGANTVARTELLGWAFLTFTCPTSSSVHVKEKAHSSYSHPNYWLVHSHFLFFSLRALFVVIQSGLHRVIYWQNLSQNPAWNQAVKTAESVNNSCRQYDFFM